MISKHIPRVGLGIILLNQDGKILVGKRKNTHAPYYSIPGGNLEPGETFEDGAIREVKEETNLSIKNPKVIGVTNNLETYNNEGLHYISIALLSRDFGGVLKNMEPKKCDGRLRVDPRNLPIPHFDGSRNVIECYLKKTFYKNSG